MRVAVPLTALALGALAGAVSVLGNAASGIAALAIGLIAGLLFLSLARLAGAGRGQATGFEAGLRSWLDRASLRALYERTRLESRGQVLVLWGSLAVLSYGVIAALIGASTPNFFGLLGFLAVGAILFVALLVFSWPVLAARPGGLVGTLWVTFAFIYIGGLIFTYQELAVQYPTYFGDDEPAEVHARQGERIAAGDPDRGIDWARPLPADSERIVLDAASRNPSDAEALAERAVDAMLTVRFYRGHGSAFVISRDGLAITNRHVADRGPPLRVRFRDGRDLPARVVRSARGPDVALIQIPCDSSCATMDLAVPTRVRLGEDVLVLGTPKTLDLHGTITRGIVSGLRDDDGVRIIQTDAAINFGNSGGPIIDVRSGRVLGIVTSSVTDRGAQGLHFGVAIDDALEALKVEIAY